MALSEFRIAGEKIPAIDITPRCDERTYAVAAADEVLLTLMPRRCCWNRASIPHKLYVARERPCKKGLVAFKPCKNVEFRNSWIAQ